MFTLFAAESVSCHCTECHESPVNSTSKCELKPGGQCFASVEVEQDGSEVWAYGCFAPVDDEGGTILQVRSHQTHNYFTGYFCTRKCPKTQNCSERSKINIRDWVELMNKKGTQR